METTTAESSRGEWIDGRATKAQGAEAARNARSAAGHEVQDLLSDVQDLLGRVAHVADPEIAKVRAKVEAGLATARRSLASGADQVQKTGREAIAASDNYVRTQPWQAVGLAAAAGVIVGFLVGRR